MTLLDALILGIVEGVTEFLPVSSTGHLILTQRALGLEDTSAADAYAICIQAGAIVAVLGLYRARVAQMVRGLLGRDPAGLRLAACIVLAFVPAAVCGLSFSAVIKAHLFGLWPVVGAWFVGGLVILAFRRRMVAGSRSIEDIDWRTAAWIGAAQCLALWPGTSRSLATMLGGVLLGLSLPAAVEFSFLLGVVTLLAATAHDGMKHGAEMINSFGFEALVVGFLAAAASAGLAVKWLVGWLQSHGMEVFAGWRIGLAVVVAALIVLGVLPAG